MKVLRLLAGCLLAPMLLTTAWAQAVSIITTPSGSYSNSAASAMAKVVTEKAKLRMIVQAQASSGFDELEAGSVEFNMSNAFDVTFVVTGTGEYEGQGVKKKIRIVASMIPYRVAMHVRADSDIKSLADLKGKRVSSGFNAQKTIGRIIEAHLANAGLSYKDVVGVPTPNVVSQANDFKAGKTDVMFFALGSAAVKEAAVTVGGIRVLPINDSAAALARMQQVLPGSYVLTVNPAPGIDGVTQPTQLTAFDMMLNSSTNVAEESSIASPRRCTRTRPIWRRASRRSACSTRPRWASRCRASNSTPAPPNIIARSASCRSRERGGGS